MKAFLGNKRLGVFSHDVYVSWGRYFFFFLKNTSILHLIIRWTNVTFVLIIFQSLNLNDFKHSKKMGPRLFDVKIIH